MILAAVLLGLCQILTMFGLCLFLRHFFNAKQAEMEAKAERALRDWVEAPEAGKPSKLALALEAAGAVVGSAAARSIMGNLKQDASSMAKVANGVSDELSGRANPIMGLLTGGKRGKGAAVMRLAEMLGPMFGAKGNGAGTVPGGEYTGRRHKE
jgi:hypothetical protein